MCRALTGARDPSPQKGSRMYRLTVRDHIMIAHSLPDPFFGPAQALHGATLVVEVTWRREQLGPQRVVLDIGAAAVAPELPTKSVPAKPAAETTR